MKSALSPASPVVHLGSGATKSPAGLAVTVDTDHELLSDGGGGEPATSGTGTVNNARRRPRKSLRFAPGTYRPGGANAGASATPLIHAIDAHLAPLPGPLWSGGLAQLTTQDSWCAVGYQQPLLAVDLVFFLNVCVLFWIIGLAQIPGVIEATIFKELPGPS
ncbi:hypothetical protein HYH03_009760 [Edaphochlamys debaryana]|uniref:Uncharacterized protein n=1 Tax=Edaphochlamys debaryana TaxID=47281 RepID=A0A835XXJ1_9CHLO|nr:hypothetical protein HYH03_009760 [Edaphochlamys debaryana]|eukprot:KAG2492031.1 hypothetical protein HYH03_009760 [Edaphochlamys debaryana]